MFFTSIWQSRLGFEQVKFMEKCDDYATSVYYIDGIFEEELQEEVRQRMKGGGY